MKLANLKHMAVLVAAGGILTGQYCAQATSIMVDQIIANPVSGTLSGTVDMTLSGNTLTITLRNTSTSSDIGANVILTGLAFDLPNSIDITGGSVSTAAGSIVLGGSMNNSSGNVSGEWGYQNGNSGHFNGLATDTQVSAMEADSNAKFSNTPIDSPAVLNGPEFGLLATGGDRGGLTAIRDSVVITLNLSGTVPANLVSTIDGGLVALTFGSPTGVPDSGATLSLLGLAMLGVAAIRRKLLKNA